MLDSPVDEIKSRLNVLDLVAGYVQLKKAGANYKGLCPFHNERTPSLVVTPAKQMWYCFGCNLGGDIFAFVKQIENVDFPQALKILADRTGVELKRPTSEQIRLGEKKQVLHEINAAATQYFVKVLWESTAAQAALDYLRQRGLNDQTIKFWQLGWAPDDFHYLENYLAKSFAKPDIELAGLIIKSDKSITHNLQPITYFDRFRGRIMFPIVDDQGYHVGFTGRLLREKEGVGKYVNSPETPVYNKSKVIFGYFAGKRAIIKAGQVIVVEGQMDVIASHQAGIANTVASSGTAFTLDQMKELGRHAREFVFAFDSDRAGSAATETVVNLAKQYQIMIKLAELGEFKDPAEAIQRGAHIWKDIVSQAPHFVEYFFHRALRELDPASAEGVQKIRDKLIPLISYVDSEVLRSFYVRKLAQVLGVTEPSVLADLRKLQRPKLAELSPPPAVAKKTRLERLQEQVLGLALLLKHNQALAQFKPADFGAYEKIYTSIITAAPDPAVAEQIKLLQFAAQTDIEEQNLDPAAVLKDGMRELKLFLVKREMETLAGQLKSAEANRDKALAQQLSAAYVALANKVGELKN